MTLASPKLGAWALCLVFLLHLYLSDVVDLMHDTSLIDL
jgi:hypothetical protein